MGIGENLREVLGQIEQACDEAGRAVQSVRLVAVSKTRTAEEVREAYDAGQRVFGENYAQEMKAKAEALSDLPDIEWHFIGHLQRNKVKYVIPHVSVVQTVDSERLLAEIAKRSKSEGRRMDVLIEVNVGEEEQKAGVDPGNTEDLLVKVEATEGVRCVGLMVIPPFELDSEEARPWFAGLRELRENLGGPERLPHLSMGMSADFPEAIEEGATLVRVGTAIFGRRR